MSWEQFLKEQADRASVLIGNSVTRFRQAIDALNPAAPPGTFADLVAKNTIQTSKEALDLLFGPFNLSRPQVPVLYFTANSGNPPQGVVRLMSDTTTAQVSVTKIFQLGGAAALDPAAVPADFTFNVQQGTLLQVITRAASVAALPSGLYHGVAVVATLPVAVILFLK